LVVTKEVASNDSEGMMFRTNSVAVKLITHLAKMVGLPYLWRTLALSIHELNDIGRGETLSKYDTKSVQMASIMAPTSIEVDPSRLEDSSDAAVNQLQLMLICQKLFTAITKSAESLPLQLRDIYRHVKIEVSVKYPEFGHKAVASFLFLRLICPCILAPHVYGLLDEPPNQECQRYLILLSKILQNLASGTLPGKKEDFLQKMNDFIASNQDPLKELIDNITVQVDTKTVESVELPKGLKQKSLEYLYDFVFTNWNAIESVLDNNQNNDNSQNTTKARMENLLNKMGAPVKKT
jgi:neurofibromin 1